MQILNRSLYALNRVHGWHVRKDLEVDGCGLLEDNILEVGVAQSVQRLATGWTIG
jgi:phenylalanyl-tRNA synthetase alpha subunit